MHWARLQLSLKVRLAVAIAEAAEIDKSQIRVEQLLRVSVLVDTIIYLDPVLDGDSVLLSLMQAITKGDGVLTQLSSCCLRDRYLCADVC